jgi:hypothetical protein
VSEPHGLERALPDLEILLVEMVAMVLGETATPTAVPLPDVPLAMARLIIQDEADDTYLGVEMRAESGLARMLASSLLGEPDPSEADVLDVIAELGNIAAGNVKSLLTENGRLSLPAPRMVIAPPPVPPGTVRAVANLLGHILELVIMPVPGADVATRWPGFASV